MPLLIYVEHFRDATKYTEILAFSSISYSKIEKLPKETKHPCVKIKEKYSPDSGSTQGSIHCAPHIFIFLMLDNKPIYAQ
ncbi:MAG: hypothetical protein SH857_15605 [Chitinophagales bacterium]|nr:hypothetical protein [Chitinophagales bacterium]